MSKRRDSSDVMKQKEKKVCVAKLTRQKATERASSTSAKIAHVEKPELQQRISSSKHKQIEPRQLQQKKHEEKDAKTNKSSSDDHWKRDLYVRGLSTSTRIKDLQKHLLETTGAEAVACSPIPGEPYYFKLTMATSKDASKCLNLLNNTELFGKNMKFERKERAPERDAGRSHSNSFGKELKDLSVVVNKNHSKAKEPKSTDRRRSRSRDRDLKSTSRSEKNQKMISVSKETKVRRKSRERSRERSRSPMKKRRRRKPSIYWDIPPFGYECMTPMQYKAIRAQEILTQTQGALFVDSTASTDTAETEDTSYIVPESIVHKLFVGGLLNHLNQEYVVNLLECERRYLEEKIQFENEREWQRIERETLEREKIEMQRERERFEREQRIEREKIKAERKELRRLQARSIAKDENAICASETTTQGTGQPKKQMSPVTDLRSVLLKARLSDHSKIEETSEAITPNRHR